MWFFFFDKFIINTFLYLLEVLKGKHNCNYTMLGVPFVMFSLWSDETAYYVFLFFYDFIFFSNLFTLQEITFFFEYIIFLFIFYFHVYIFDFPFVNLYLYLFFGFFILFLLLSMLFFFFFSSIVLNSIDVLFKSKIAGLLLFSKDFISIEDEDLWVSSNLFYFDNKVLESKDFKTSLSVHEIEVFFTIIKLFFDTPLKNKEYHFFSDQLFLYRNNLRNHLTSKKNESEDFKTFFLNLKKSSFQRFPKFKSSLNLFENNDVNSLKKNTLSVSTLKDLFVNSRVFSNRFFFFFFRLLNFFSLSPKAERALRLKRRFQKRERRLYIQIKKKAFYKYQIFKKSNLKKFSNTSNIDNQFIMRKNRETIFNYYRSLNDNLSFHSISQKSSDVAFSFFRRQTPYNDLNNKLKLQRFRRFLWFSFPYYIVQTSLNLSSFFFNNKIFNLFSYFYQTFISKIVYFIFSLFGDYKVGNNPLLLYYYTFYDPYFKTKKIEKTFFQFFISKDKTGESIIQKTFQSLFSFDSDSKEENADNNESQNLVSKASLKNKGMSKKKNTEESPSKIKSVNKERRYRRYLKRKTGTLRKAYLISSNKYNFSNKFNSSSIFSQPRIEAIDFYKLLEYFYFILTNDIDFYENAQFMAKVEVLRQKYGRPIVADLLDRADHKQAKKVSVKMHISEVEIQVGATNLISKDSQFSDSGDNGTLKNDALVKNQLFYESQNKSIFYKKPVRLISDLILSYKYRFKK